MKKAYSIFALKIFAYTYDQEYVFKSFRMDSTTFELLFSWVGPLIKKSCLRRSVASPAERLSVTLRHLVTGDAHITISV